MMHGQQNIKFGLNVVIISVFVIYSDYCGKQCNKRVGTELFSFVRCLGSVLPCDIFAKALVPLLTLKGKWVASEN